MSTMEDLYTGNEPLAILRKRFAFLAENDFCAAFILDQFVAEIARREEYAWYRGKYDREQTEGYDIERSIQQITDSLFGLFSYDQVVVSLNFLIKKQYIGNNGRVEGTKDTYIFPVNRQKIDRDSSLYKGNVSVEPLVATDLLLYSPMETPSLSQGSSTTSETKPGRRNEGRRVDYHNNRASRVGLPATLTLQQWTRTLDDFNEKCAICLDGPYDVLEHFVPIIQGGGTTEYNCIPACTQCNRVKHDLHPSMVPASTGIVEGLERVKQYLETRRSVEE